MVVFPSPPSKEFLAAKVETKQMSEKASKNAEKQL
jgi:hypothetical protein